MVVGRTDSWFTAISTEIVLFYYSCKFVSQQLLYKRIEGPYFTELLSFFSSELLDEAFDPSSSFILHEQVSSDIGTH